MENMGLRLREERHRLNLTQALFAKAGGVAPNAQVNYESGKRLPKADYLELISRLGVDISYVVTGITGSRSSPKDLVPRASTSVASINSHLDQDAHSQLDQLGEILWMTAATVASIATMKNSCETVSQRMAENLREFQSESQRFIALACDLGHA